MNNKQLLELRIKEITNRFDEKILELNKAIDLNGINHIEIGYILSDLTTYHLKFLGFTEALNIIDKGKL